MSGVAKVALSGLVQLIAVAVLLFVAAGTLDYWQAWVFLIVFALSAWAPSIYLQLTHPGTLARRIRGGPAAETRTVQKVAMAGLYGSLAAMCITGGLDRRFDWSSVPTALCWNGDVLVALGLAGVVAVVIQNRYSSTTVRVEAGQHVVSSGLYKLVRHPMYTGNALMLMGLPFALGSYWALVFVVPGLIVLASRIFDEEKLLGEELAGYREYVQKVRYRLVPGIW